MAKAKKKRAKKYDDKLAIKGNFEEVIKVSVAGNSAPKPKGNKKKAKKKPAPNDFQEDDRELGGEG